MNIHDQLLPELLFNIFLNYLKIFYSKNMNGGSEREIFKVEFLGSGNDPR
uniref:Uncharacterized protein n=1 Tax=Meloidogyne enterolobii TaxID=390850 RepID=A0A6V7VWN4_MELEN|nr:unnamed protein product [Meloidogyne enterolobii]